MEWDLIKTLAALVGCILGILSFYEKIWGATADLKAKVLVLEERGTDPDILERITALETRIGPFWRVLEENLVEFLRRPTHLEMDKLLDEYKEKHGDLTLDELNILKFHLLGVIEDFKAQKRAKELEDSGKVVGYVFMLGIVESKICEKEARDVCKKGLSRPQSKEARG